MRGLAAEKGSNVTARAGGRTGRTPAIRGDKALLGEKKKTNPKSEEGTRWKSNRAKKKKRGGKDPDRAPAKQTGGDVGQEVAETCPQKGREYRHLKTPKNHRKKMRKRTRQGTRGQMGGGSTGATMQLHATSSPRKSKPRKKRPEKEMTSTRRPRAFQA